MKYHRGNLSLISKFRCCWQDNPREKTVFCIQKVKFERIQTCWKCVVSHTHKSVFHLALISYCITVMCGRKVMRLAVLCTNQQCCCYPLHMAVRLIPAVDSLQVWTCYNCYVTVESIWSEVVFVKCVMKMDRQKLEQRCAIKFCVKLDKSATVAYEKLQRAYWEHSLSWAQVFRWHKSVLEGQEQVEDESRVEHGRSVTTKGREAI
jgi:hypothetical protein